MSDPVRTHYVGDDCPGGHSETHDICMCEVCRVTRSVQYEKRASEARRDDLAKAEAERDALREERDRLREQVKRWESKETHEAMECYHNEERVKDLEAMARLLETKLGSASTLVLEAFSMVRAISDTGLVEGKR